MRTPETQPMQPAQPETGEPNLLLDGAARDAHVNALHAASLAEMYQDQQFAETLAGEYYKKGLEAYDKFMQGDRWGKQMYLALLATGAINGMGGVLLGNPGGGKSHLIKYGHQIVEDIEGEHVARVPHTSTLTAAQLIGEETPMVRKVLNEDGTATEEAFNAIVKAIIRPETKVVKFDEVNRTNPFAVQAALEVLQEGRTLVYSNGEPVETDEFDLVIAALNHHGTEYTYKLDPALLNRLAAGAFMGERPRSKDEEGKLRGGKYDEQGNYIPRSGLSEGARDALLKVNEDPRDRADIKVDKVVDLEGLHIIRNAIHRVKYGEAELDLTDKLTVKMLDVMEAEGVASADNRIIRQVTRLGQVLALMNKRPVTDIDVGSAINYAMTARLGSVGTKSYDRVMTRINDVLKAA